MKKDILKIVGLLLLLGLTAGTNVSEAKAMSNERETLNFNTGWLYSPSDYTNGQLILFDDSGFESISVPHANTVLKTHKGDDFQSQIESYRFVSWYRRHFSLSEEYSDKRIIVEFQGVSTAADVYVNGKYAGSHKGAYTGFSFDITDYITTDGSDNVLAVRVDSTKRSDIPPEGGSVDYCLFGGIVRDVTMLVVNPLYVDDAFFTTPDLSAESGAVNALITVLNSSGNDKICTAEVVIYDANGNAAASGQAAALTVSSGESVEFDISTTEIKNPHLWDVDDPYLYTAEVTVYEGGNVTDRYEAPIGMRWFEFRSAEDDGCFYLNGRKLKIRGVNRHEQWPWQGRAVPNKLQTADADLIKETGFNAVRCSHYPQDPEFLTRCDELGLIVFEEAPGWQYIGDSDWQEVYKTNIEEMILRDRNHPSIVTWGVRVNESWDNSVLYTSTTALAKSLDPTRPTHGVRRMENYDTSENIEDIFCVNYTYPETPKYTPFVITEHSMDWYNGNGFPWASDAAAAVFTKSFADAMNYYYGNDLCAGGFAWSMFDYNNEVNYTRTGNVFYSGVYDLFRLDKPVSYLYRSQKSPDDETVLYIASYWTENSPSEVQVYSNCDKVELLVNGISRGIIEPNLYMNLPHPVFSFTGFAYEEGELEAVGYIDGKEVARTVRRTPGAAAKLALEADYTNLIADGTDMTCVTVSLLDKNGTRLPYADNAVNITVEGPAEFIGESPVSLEGGRIGFIVKSRFHETGTVVCTVSADGVESASCEIEVSAYNDENVVPYSVGSGSVKPIGIKEINDNDGSFAYSAGWLYCTQSGCYSNDNHYSDIVGDTVTVTFNGDAIEWYGTKAPAHGIMGISVDGGAETFIDCYSPLRQDNILLYSSGSLGLGEHTLTVRVTGDKNINASGYYVNADHVRILDNGVSIGNRVMKGGIAPTNTDSSSWISTDGVYSQNDDSFGDHMYFADSSNLTDYRISAFVNIPTAEDTGCGILGRVQNETSFYQLELKYENGGLIWGIWKSENGAWTQLAFGPYNLPYGSKTTALRLELHGEHITAYTSADGADWTALGSASDSSFSTGGTGLRTHNMAGEFSGVTVFETIGSSEAEYELKEVTINNGALLSLRLNCLKTEGAFSDRLIAARYSDDGVLEQTADFEIGIDGIVNLDGFAMDGNVKLFVWNSLEGIAPLSMVWKM